MKIVDIAEFYSPQGGGVRTYIEQKLSAAHRQGLDVTIIAPAAEDRVETRKDGRIIWVRAPSLPVDRRYHQFFSGRGVAEILDSEPPDILEASSFWRGAWLAAKWRPPAGHLCIKSLIIHQDPVAVYPHTLLDNRLSLDRIDALFGWFWRYLQKLSAHFDTAITAGARLADRMRRFGIAQAVPVDFGIDKSGFSPGLADPELRRSMLAEIGLGEDAALLVAVSRHHPEKRLPVLIDAVARANAERPIGLYLVGDGPIRGRINKAGAKVPQVHVAGPIRNREQLARKIASADAFAHAGAAETFGLVLSEALCAGLPLIVPDRGGAAEIADPAYSESYATGKAEACAAAMLRLLNRDQAALKQAAIEAAAHRVRSHEDHFSELFAHYRRLLTPSRPNSADAA